MDRGAWQATVHQGRKELDMIKGLSTHTYSHIHILSHTHTHTHTHTKGLEKEITNTKKGNHKGSSQILAVFKSGPEG